MSGRTSSAPATRWDRKPWDCARRYSSRTRWPRRNGVSSETACKSTSRMTVSVEWPAMKAGDHGPRSAGDGRGKVLTALLADDHAGGNRRAAEEHTVRALERALDAQRQRLFISQTSVSCIKWFVFMVLAGLIELTIAMIHVENRSTKVITMLIFATAVAVSTLLIMAYDRPFGGGVSVTPAALTDVLPR